MRDFNKYTMFPTIFQINLRMDAQKQNTYDRNIHSPLHLAQQTMKYASSGLSDSRIVILTTQEPKCLKTNTSLKVELSHTPSPSDLARADVTHGAQVKQEVVVREGCLRVRYAAMVTLTTKHLTGCDLSVYLRSL